MSTKQDNQPSAEKNPDAWVTGDEAMTGPQASYLKTLAQEAGEEIDPDLTKAEASKKIEELQHETGRGRRRHNSVWNAAPRHADDGVRLVDRAGQRHEGPGLGLGGRQGRLPRLRSRAALRPRA